METYNAMIKFINALGEAFSAVMFKVANSVNQLEVANLGIDSNVSSTLFF